MTEAVTLPNYAMVTAISSGANELGTSIWVFVTSAKKSACANADFLN